MYATDGTFVSYPISGCSYGSFRVQTEDDAINH